VGKCVEGPRGGRGTKKRRPSKKVQGGEGEPENASEGRHKKRGQIAEPLEEGLFGKASPIKGAQFVASRKSSGSESSTRKKMCKKGTVKKANVTF